jgi:hypothetical protein
VSAASSLSSANELRNANYVVGKQYTSVNTVEIEDPSREDEVLPVIVVSDGGAAYDFRTMGLGEFAALGGLWRLRQVKAGTVILLEEPETYLSARASIALLDVLAARIDATRLYAVVTTHSPGVMSHSPLEQLVLLAPGPDGAIALRTPESRHELDQMLGVPAGNVRLVRECQINGGCAWWVYLILPSNAIANALSAGFRLIAQRAFPRPVGSRALVRR